MPFHCFPLSLSLSLSLSLHCWVDSVVLIWLLLSLREKVDLFALEVGDVDEAEGAKGGADGQGGAVGDLVELFGTKVIEEDMEGEDVFDGVDGRVGGEEVRHGGIVDGADSYDGAAVDLVGEVREGEVVVEGQEVWVLS